WYFDGVMYAYGHGLMNGTSADKFSPEDSLTRAMIVTILYRQAGEPEVFALDNLFSDVPAGTWYTEAVKWAAENGIVSGYGNGKFGTNDAVTKEQLAAILYRLQQSGEKTPQDILMDREYPDFKEISDYAKGAVTKLTMQGIFRDIPGVNFSPKESATRAGVASMLYRFLTALE
ncbi:MAG: S-layer homology domain-containing protein, partial [Clostridiales bacterium]|nr:S-layer homology domain-containing protein [Clostridiales bacterium]